MAFSKSELDRYADDAYKDRRITSSVYCGHCGYNLRTLPYIYTCPECGNQYNARPLNMKGIYAPQAVDVPFGDMAAAVFCGLTVFLLARNAFSPLDLWRAGFTVVFVVFTVMFLSRVYDRFAVLMKARRVARRIAMDEE